MKAKLIKQNGIGVQTIDGIDYYLILDNKIYHTNPLTSALSNGGKLSLKNCQAIERGYDLDELIKERFGETFWHDGDKHFKEGFQKALEILGDKKFSEENIKDAYNMGMLRQKVIHEAYMDPGGRFVKNNKEKCFDETGCVKSFQQTEWDVEVVIEVINNGKGEDGLLHETVEPKLDENGCLILKRI